LVPFDLNWPMANLGQKGPKVPIWPLHWSSGEPLGPAEHDEINHQARPYRAARAAGRPLCCHPAWSCQPRATECPPWPRLEPAGSRRGIHTWWCAKGPKPGPRCPILGHFWPKMGPFGPGQPWPPPLPLGLHASTYIIDFVDDVCIHFYSN